MLTVAPWIHESSIGKIPARIDLVGYLSTNPEERSVDSWENAVMFSGENVRSQFLQSVITRIELV